jgi:hypothetical protein
MVVLGDLLHNQEFRKRNGDVRKTSIQIPKAKGSLCKQKPG